MNDKEKGYLFSVSLASKMAGYKQTVHDLRVYLRGFHAAGGKLDITGRIEDVEEALSNAELLLSDYHRKLLKEIEKETPKGK